MNAPFSWYGIEVGQVAVSKIDYEEKVIAQIATQQESNMLIQTARAQALAARQEAVRVEEAGRATAAKAKWDQEAIKATAVTRAEQEREVARLDSERAAFEKAATIARGQADAEAARLKVAAGLDPVTRATIEKETAIGIAEALAKSNVRWVPEVMVNGQSGSGVNAMDAVGINMLQNIVRDMGNK